MIEIKNKQILIDGKPQLIMAGEIHYYRLDREDWQDRIDKLKMAGMNAVATYVPWLIHEPVEGEFDLTGKTRPETDLQAFIDLCQENGLYFFLRPGPFIMAEMKNEGLPYWVYEKYPEIVPIGWDEKPATTPTVDYLHPGFLESAKKWYEALMEVAAPRIYPNGNIIAFQLDNEIGMLSWVSNTPDLTDFVLDDFTEWVSEKYDANTLSERYPIDFSNKEARNNAIRSPKESYSLYLMKDLGYYMRHRFTKYVSVLRSYAEEFGVKGIPFVVNIHGMGGGRAFTFPIGISQLYETYQEPGYLSGSDIYFGDITMETFQDLYLLNGFMDSVHLPDQPITSVEFNCGDGNFGNNLSGRNDPSATDFRARMCVAQGARLINYYLFAGGRNYRLDELPGDGNDRIAATGEHHGFAAPVGPTGKLNYTFPRMARSVKTLTAVADKVAAMDEERDNIAFAFIPDYYMTEYHYPHSEKMKDILENLTRNRDRGGAWESVARAMLLKGHRFGSIDIQNKPFSVEDTEILALPSAKYMAAHVQEKLVNFMNEGGKILLYGEVPQFDMEGNECTLLADALDVKVTGEKHGYHGYYLSVNAVNWAAPRPETRTHIAQTLTSDTATPILEVYGTNEMCAFDATVGKGRAVVIAAYYPCDLTFFGRIFEQLGVKATLTHDYEDHGIFSTSTANAEGERFIHLINLDGLDKEFKLYHNGEALFEGRDILLQNKEAVMLPINLKLDIGEIVYSTAEILNVEANAIEFRLTQAQDVIALKTDKEIVANSDYKVEQKNGITYVYSNKHGKADPQLIIKFN
ncbi:beta-galactosidase [Lederbergia graminis]|uniref:Beta-galactosidase n=1 Tax=Lederbergia graminis TaxID=735518 RepID=A0ABW0LK34_9BACI